MERMGRPESYAVAVFSSIVLLAAGAASLLMTCIAAKYIIIDHHDLNWILAETRLPFLVQLSWLFLTLGVAGSLVSLTVYAFRARWFWRCLVIACFMLMLSPSIHAIFGVIGLVVLIATRKKFPLEKAPQPAEG